MTDTAPRLAALQAHLATRNLHGFFVPLTDEHMSEYVGGYARRLEWLTGFRGSAGCAALAGNRAAVFVDGRYTLQVRSEVDDAQFEICQVPAEPLIGWLADAASAGARIGYDPWLATRPWVQATNAALAASGAELVAVVSNPIDAVWPDRPQPSVAPAIVHQSEFAGQTSAEKRAELAAELQRRSADMAVVAALDSVAWLFNIRGADVPRTPVVRAFALVNADATATLFVDPVKISPDVAQHLGADVAVQPYTEFAAALASLSGRTVMADPGTCVAAIFSALEAAGAAIIEARDPTIALKAAKTAVELDGTRAAHIRDGLAVSRFLYWFEGAAAAGDLDELKAQARLEAFRRESNLLRDLSFDSISAFAGNGASPHYHSTPDSNLPITGNSLYLIDSGGQYPDGTTDITRTIAVGMPSAEMRDRFTRVLKGHIALATARFPKGTRGGQLDILARQFLWSAGLDYAHGTGHGVGSYLSVHEGPQRIAAAIGAPGIDEPLVPGMILSNEPGFYKSGPDGKGEYGIRIENLVVVVENPLPGDEQPMHAFETVTLAPIDQRLIEVGLLTAPEIAWLDSYHARVRETHESQLSGSERDWLMAATAPLKAAIQAAA